MTVTQIVEADARNVLHAANQPRELVGQAARLMSFAIVAPTDQGFAGLPDPEGQKCLSLLPLQAV